jgi:hypothetical protein
MVADTEEVPNEERWEAASRLATSFSAKFRDPAAARVIREERANRGRPAAQRWLREQVFPEAIMLVFAHLNEPRYMKLGSKWVLSRRIPMDPENALTSSDFRRWFRQEVRNSAEAILLERSYPRPLDTETHPPTWEPGWSLDPVYESAALLRKAGVRLSPKQRELLKHLASGVPVSQVHAVMGISPATSRVMLHQIRQRQRA